MMNLALRSIFVHTCKLFLDIVESYEMGPSRFTSTPKEGVLRIFVALRSPSPRPGLIPLTFGRMTNSLTITPPRRI
jgi:hypothetical protein